MDPSLQYQLETLEALRRILAARARNPRTCPRRAIEAEEELAGVTARVADLRVKIETAGPAADIIAFPSTIFCAECRGKGILKGMATGGVLVEFQCRPCAGSGRVAASLKTGN